MEKSKEFLRKYRLTIVFGLLFSVPLILQFNPWNFSTWLKGLVRIGTPRDWLGFWSSYLGSILSICFAYFNTKAQLNYRSHQEYLTRLIDIRKILRHYTISASENLTKGHKKAQPNYKFSHYKKDHFDIFFKDSKAFFVEYEDISRSLPTSKSDDLKNIIESIITNYKGLRREIQLQIIHKDEVTEHKASKDVGYFIIDYVNSLVGAECKIDEIIEGLEST